MDSPRRSCTSFDATARSTSLRDAVLAFACVVACRLLASIPCHLYDDAFITMRYAQNLAAGRGFVYNPGAPWEPVLGTTTPGYTLVLALGSVLGANVAVFAVVFNAICDGIVAVLLLRLLGDLAGVIALALFAVLPQLNRISAGGMESPLFVLAALAAFHFGHRRKHIRAGFLAAFSGLVRPEGVLTVAVLAVHNCRDRRALLRSTFVPIAVGLAYIAAATAYFGSPIPQSVVAKAHEQAAGLGRVTLVLRESFAPSAALALGLPLTLVGMWRCIRITGLARWYTVWVLLLTGAYLAAGPKVWGWYFYPVLTADCLWLSVGLVAMLNRTIPRLGARLTTRHLPRLCQAVCVICVAATGVYAAYRGGSPVRSGIYAAMQHWADSALPAEACILAYDIGAIGYYSQARILDSAGLVWPAAANADQAQLIKDNHPDYVLLTAVRAHVQGLRADPELGSAYTPVARFNAAEDKSLWPPPDSLPTSWRQDYILYARKNTRVTSTNSGTRMPHE